MKFWETKNPVPDLLDVFCEERGLPAPNPKEKETYKKLLDRARSIGFITQQEYESYLNNGDI